MLHLIQKQSFRFRLQIFELVSDELTSLTPISTEIHFRDLLRLSSPSHEISYTTMAATKNLISELPGRSKLQAGVLVAGDFWGSFDQLHLGIFTIFISNIRSHVS